MVATLVRLRFLLLANTLRRNVWQLVAVIIGGLYGLGILAIAVGGLVALSFGDIALARTVIVLAGSALLLGWMVVPVLTTGLDQTVDPAHLATFPIPRDRLLVALAVSGVLGIPGIVTTIATLATAITWWKFPLAAVIAVPCALIGVVTCVVGSRMLGAIATRVGAGRRARETRTLLVFIPLILLGPILLALGQFFSSISDVLPRIAGILSFTPFGAIWAVPGSIVAGDGAAAALQLGIGLVTLTIFWLLWVGPIVALLLSMSIYTDVSYDNTAFALHLQKGVRGVDDRLGRVVGLAVFAVPVSLVIVVASVAVVGQWDWLVGILAVTMGVLLSGFAVSSVLSGWLTFPVPAPGESPFKSRPGGGFGLLLSTLGSWTVLGILVVPELALALVGFATGTALFGWLALVVALALGGALLGIGVRVGGRILDARGPALLVQLQNQK